MESVWNVGGVRAAIRQRRLTFPSQVPIFKHLQRPDIQWRIVLLYFVHGWKAKDIARRYGISCKRVSQLLRQWVGRAVQLGYVARIPRAEECVTSPCFYEPRPGHPL
jgi:hypothetical protein